MVRDIIEMSPQVYLGIDFEAQKENMDKNRKLFM
jgi:hypothetical protein